MAKRPSKGEIYECRVARLFYSEGAFVRRAVDLQLQFGERFTVTDVDVLGVSFSPELVREVSVCECKTTEARNAPSAADRLLWGAGVRRLVPGARRQVLATTRPANDNVRGLARRLDAHVLDLQALEHRERLLGLDSEDLRGPHDPELLGRQREAFELARADDELKRVWNFVRSEFWFSTDVYGLKRCLGALRLLAKRWHPDLPQVEERGLKWIVHELMAAMAISLSGLAGECYRQPPPIFERRLFERLSEGAVPFAVMQELGKDVDKYVMAVMREAGLDPGDHVQRLGAFQPSPPGYAESLMEVLARLAGSPQAIPYLSVQFDGRLAASRGSTPRCDPVPVELRAEGDHLLATVRTFLRGQIKVPDELLTPMERAEQGRAEDVSAESADSVADGRGSAAAPLFSESRSPRAS